jgi:hypothetical protein
MKAVPFIILAAMLATVLIATAKTACRDAKTGQFVSQAYAKKYPGLTTCEKVKRLDLRERLRKLSRL